MQKITVKDIAERVRRPGEQLQTAIDRVRNWTKEGFLSVVGDKNPGIGRARKYSKNALLEAALLDMLSDAGMTAAGTAHNMRKLMEISKKYWEPFQSAHQARRPAPGDDRPLLVVSNMTGGMTLFYDMKLSELQDFMLSGRATLHTIIDLEILFERLLKPLEKD